MELYADKQYPENYSNAVMKVLDAMSLSGLKGLKVVGSASIRSQQFAGDYDATETLKVKSISEVVEALRAMVKRVRMLPETYITDIKCGEVADWNVFSPRARIEDGQIKDFNITHSKGIVDRLEREKVVSPDEAKEMRALLSAATDDFGFMDAKKNIRVHILRWRPIDILNGVLDYRGRPFLLEDAIQSGGLLKTDVVSNVHDRFTEFSVITDVFVNGTRVTKLAEPYERSIKEDIVYYNKVSPFKALKRLFALAKYFKSAKAVEALVPILNSDLGRLYQIVGDLHTLLDLLERPSPPVTEIREQIDEVRQRLGNIYLLRDYLKGEHSTIGSIMSLLKTQPSGMKRKLEALIDRLEGILDDGTEKITGDIGKKVSGVL
jgi:hypothetical protein